MVNKCVEVPACHRVGLPQGRQVEVTYTLYTLYTLYTNIPIYLCTYRLQYELDPSNHRRFI